MYLSYMSVATLQLICTFASLISLAFASTAVEPDRKFRSLPLNKDIGDISLKIEPNSYYLPPPPERPKSSLSKRPQVLLGEPCDQTSDCKPELSECHQEYRVCTCRAYSVEANITTCLPGTLLGFRCETDQQCAVKVPSSGCVNGVCSCGDGYVAYRRHTCLTPAKQGEVCFENQQCSLADRGSYCKFVVPRVFGRCQCQAGKSLNGDNRCASVDIKIGQPCEEENDCSMPNAFCQKKLDGNSFCTCDIAFAPSSDMKRCLPTYRGILPATSLGYPCYAHLQCQLADPNSICNEGVCDCASSAKLKSTSKCNAKMTGCHKNTFQCQSDGKCISWFFVCDGKIDCADGSDEVCDSEAECPPQAFSCGESRGRSLPENNSSLANAMLQKIGNGKTSTAKTPPTENMICISKSKLCDGEEDCENGADEVGCKVGKGKCPKGTFQCETSKECIPENQFCNAIADCRDWSDENELKCRTEFQPSEFCPFRCDNGLCRSSAILCSGIDGCGDNSDETKCSVCRCPRVSGLSQPLEVDLQSR